MSATTVAAAAVVKSQFVCFGTLKCVALKPSVVSVENITVTIEDTGSEQRVTMQIAFKHVARALMCHNKDTKAIAFVVSGYCASKIRETLQICTTPAATSGSEMPYFDPESSRFCQRYQSQTDADMHFCCWGCCSTECAKKYRNLFRHEMLVERC
ncbi:unnamed protein product [Gongylonema pulchrum]|uniref:Alba domain-containing protein n=1 Tax=Gongylonema pulchrum TaxID=637853 RepID=A0A183ES60_9BILA|nr:unnamed protein product [Gongylonema pulchrum]